MTKYCKDCLMKDRYIESKLDEINMLLRSNRVLQSHIDSLYLIIMSLISNNSIKVVIKK